jgi:hypothetical protein
MCFSVSVLCFQLPFVLNKVFEFPKMVAFKFSPLLFLQSGGLNDLPTLQELIHTYRPSFNPLEWIPPYRGMRPIGKLNVDLYINLKYCNLLCLNISLMLYSMEIIFK